jgi:hypothetical protein
MNLKLILVVSAAVIGICGGITAQQPDKAAQAELAKKYPSLRIETKVGSRRRQLPGSSYMKRMTVTPSVLFESSATHPISSASATFLLITMNTREKYTRGDELLTVATNETIQIPAAAKGSRRSFEFASLETTFDSERDSTNVGGTVYKYYIAAVFADDRQFLHFETNCTTLAKHLEAHPELRTKFLSLKPNETFRTRFQ